MIIQTRQMSRSSVTTNLFSFGAAGEHNTNLMETILVFPCATVRDEHLNPGIQSPSAMCSIGCSLAPHSVGLFSASLCLSAQCDEGRKYFLLP